jgi:hypothetical protein
MNAVGFSVTRKPDCPFQSVESIDDATNGRAAGEIRKTTEKEKETRIM